MELINVKNDFEYGEVPLLSPEFEDINAINGPQSQQFLSPFGAVSNTNGINASHAYIQSSIDSILGHQSVQQLTRPNYPNNDYYGNGYPSHNYPPLPNDSNHDRFILDSSTSVIHPAQPLLPPQSQLGPRQTTSDSLEDYHLDSLSDNTDTQASLYSSSNNGSPPSHNQMGNYPDLTTMVNSNTDMILPMVESRFVDKTICSICGKKITRDMLRHTRTHHENSRFSCRFPKSSCNHKSGQFNRPYDFKKHLLNRHFKFDNPNAKKFHNLSYKWFYWGVCACGERFLSNDWLENHVLTKDPKKLCPLIDIESNDD